MSNYRALFLFTAGYPYGKVESFLEDEILYLSKSFGRVVIVPLSGGGTPTRKVPSNCEVLYPIINNRKKQYKKGLFCVKSFAPFLKDFIKGKVYCDKRRLKAWGVAYVLINNLLKSKTIRNIFSNIHPNDVCYFYWGKGTNLLSCFYKKKAKFVSRFHGEWDLWEESSGGYAPCRKLLSESLDLAVFISQKGELYYKSKYYGCNTAVFPLGSLDYGKCDVEKSDNILRVVSCSTVYPLKRVPLIFEALNSMTSCQIEWTHIGGGKDFCELKQKVEKEKKTHLTVRLLGNMSHDDVMAYYKNHQFDVFVNMSTNEGVPVSIMEAESFNIPVVATNVGSTSEVVTEQSGVLITETPSLNEIADAIIKASNSGLSPREFWKSKYNADLNYTLFAEKLLNL